MWSVHLRCYFLCEGHILYSSCKFLFRPVLWIKFFTFALTFVYVILKNKLQQHTNLYNFAKVLINWLVCVLVFPNVCSKCSGMAVQLTRMRFQPQWNKQFSQSKCEKPILFRVHYFRCLNVFYLAQYIN